MLKEKTAHMKKPIRAAVAAFAHRLLKREAAAHEVSLNGYLKAASICYLGAYGHSVDHMTPRQMYNTFSDRRDGGMLAMKKPESRKEFAKWLASNKWKGSHPFEIIGGMGTFGIHLVPPSEEKPFYLLRLGNGVFAALYLKMAAALSENGVRHQAPDLARASEECRKKR